jgi:hypothetical protein
MEKISSTFQTQSKEDLKVVQSMIRETYVANMMPKSVFVREGTHWSLCTPHPHLTGGRVTRAPHRRNTGPAVEVRQIYGYDRIFMAVNCTVPVSTAVIRVIYPNRER